MKYWSLACKLQLMQTGQDVNKMNRLFNIIFFLGAAVNLAACVVGSWVFVQDYSRTSFSASNGWIDTLAFALAVILLISCCFLGDAFRRLKSVGTES
jgi:hypothetical protein